MPSLEYSRSERLSGLIRTEVAQLLRHKARDPRFARASIASVVVSSDCHYADILVVLWGEADSAEVLQALNSAAGYFRSHLAKVCRLRRTPHIRFKQVDLV